MALNIYCVTAVVVSPSVQNSLSFSKSLSGSLSLRGALQEASGFSDGADGKNRLRRMLRSLFPARNWSLGTLPPSSLARSLARSLPRCLAASLPRCLAPPLPRSPSPPRSPSHPPPPPPWLSFPAPSSPLAP
jgi:hypothetical protein